MDRRTIIDLQFQRILDAAGALCQTTPGHGILQGLTPVRNVHDAHDSLERVREALVLLTHSNVDERPSLEGIEDISHLVATAQKGGVLAGTELVTCARLIQRSSETFDIVRRMEFRCPRLYEDVSVCADLEPVSQRITDTFDADGRILDDASPTLRELRQKVHSLSRRVKVIIEEMVSDSKVQMLLQDDYYTLRDGRYVLPVKAEDHRFVPGIIHGTSQTGATYFVEPSRIVEDNNQLKVVVDAIAVEERTILADRSRLLGRYANEVNVISSAIWVLDSILGRARFALSMGSGIPDIAGAGEGMRISGAVNPVLKILKRDVVPIDVSLDSAVGGGALIISGPNAGGKSVALSTIGLSAVMLRHAILPPVRDASRVPWYDNIYTVTADPTSMDQAVSTFTGQIERLKDVLNRPNGRTLVLIDELATGTEPRKGEALATSVVEAIVESGAECVVATHFDGLKKKASEPGRFVNARVGTSAASGMPTYAIELGQIGESNPFEVARSVGLSPAILARAMELVGDREARLEEALAKAVELNAKLLEERKETVAIRDRLASDKKTYENELKRLRADSDRLVYEARKDVLEKMKRLEVELDVIARQARESAKAKAAEEEAMIKRRREVKEKKIEVQVQMEKEAELVEDIPRNAVADTDLVPGALVFVMGLRTNGTIVDVSQDRKRATVQVGALRSSAKVKDLRKVEAKTAKPVEKPKKDSSPKVAPSERKASVTLEDFESTALFVRTEQNTVDVRGMYVDSAISAVEKLLDNCYMNQTELVMIIHGHGTSTLKKAIRTALKESSYVSSHRPGEMNEGGDGVTIVTIK